MKKYLQLFLAIFIVSMLSNDVFSQTDIVYVADKKIDLPGDGGYDYLFIDQHDRRLYVSHGTAVHVINLDTEELIGTIEEMQGNHGIAVAHSVNRGFISDGKANSVFVFDLSSLRQVSTIPLSGKKPDAIVYDIFSNQVFAFNGGSDNVSVINASSLKEGRVIALNGAPEFAVVDGHGKLYNNIEDKNTLKVIDTKSLEIMHSFPLIPCGGPTGLALDTVNNRLFTACRENKGLSVLDIYSGKVITTIPIGAGVDAVCYDGENKLIFCSNGDGTATIIRQQTPDKYTIQQTLSTQSRAKTMALDVKTHKIYFSVADFETGSKNMIPGSFKIMVYKIKQL